MASKVGRWGGSLSVRLPKEVALAAGLQVGDQVSVRLLDSGDLRVRPLKSPVVATREAAKALETSAPKW